MRGVLTLYNSADEGVLTLYDSADEVGVQPTLKTVLMTNIKTMARTEYVTTFPACSSQ